MSDRPLFIALKIEFFDLFLSGDKRSELRIYGPRWNERTCPPGREVVLSKGYGKRHRIRGVIREFHKRRADTFGSTYRGQILKAYGTLDLDIAEIRLDLNLAKETTE